VTCGTVKIITGDQTLQNVEGNNMKKWKNIGALFFLLTTFTAQTETITGRVFHISDGDTLKILTETNEKIRIRLAGIDTPESRTRNLEEKKFGLAAKQALKDLLGKKAVLRTQIARDGEDAKGKFGRILGDFDVYCPVTDSWRGATKILVEQGHAVPYFGGSKEEVDAQHLLNRERLIAEGVVVL
jgi:micrococcal nuclease